MKILKTEINAVYPGNEGNRVGLSYGRIAYDKATENEKKSRSEINPRRSTKFVR